MRALFLAAAAVTLSGCGTVCNLAGGIKHPDSEPRIYGGVQRDVEFLEDVANTREPWLHLGSGPAGVVGLGCLAALAVGDPVLSFVGDTLTLPITVPLQHSREAGESKQDSGVTVPSSAGAESIRRVEPLPSARPAPDVNPGGGG